MSILIRTTRSSILLEPVWSCVRCNWWWDVRNNISSKIRNQSSCIVTGDVLSVMWTTSRNTITQSRMLSCVAGGGWWGFENTGSNPLVDHAHVKIAAKSIIVCNACGENGGSSGRAASRGSFVNLKKKMFSISLQPKAPYSVQRLMVPFEKWTFHADKRYILQGN